MGSMGKKEKKGRGG